MVRLFGSASDPECDEIRSLLERTVLAYDFIDVDDVRNRRLPDLGPLPILVDGGRPLCGLAAVKPYVRDFALLSSRWRSH